MGKKDGAPTKAAQQAQLRRLKLNLMGTREKLMLVSPDLLKDDEHAAWSKQIFDVSLAISAIRNKELADLSDRFTKELPRFNDAMEQLTNDLFKLQKAVQVIKAVDAALGVVTSIIKLA